MNDLILNTTKDGRNQIKLRAQKQTVWLTQLEMAELPDATKQNISLQLKNVFEDRELDPAATVKESLTVQIELRRTLVTEDSSVTARPAAQSSFTHGNLAGVPTGGQSPIH